MRGPLGEGWDEGLHCKRMGMWGMRTKRIAHLKKRSLLLPPGEGWDEGKPGV